MQGVASNGEKSGDVGGESSGEISSERSSEISVALGELAGHLGAVLIGDPAQRVSRIGPLLGADLQTISFLSHPRYEAQMLSSSAGCVIVSTAMRETALARTAAAGEAATATLVCDDPYLAFARLTQWWAQRRRAPTGVGVHGSAVVEEGAFIDPSATVAAFCHIARGAHIGAAAVIGAFGHVGEGASVGAGTLFKPRVTLQAGCVIGKRGLVHSGVVIGADGFGFAPAAGRWEKIEQLGGVHIGDDVEIGANTCIDRGALDDTVIEDGVKLDNLVQIGHNVRVGAHSAFAGCVGVAGSARIGKHCTAGGGAIILGHLEIVDHVHITAATVVSRSIHKPGQYSGAFPFDDNASWEKNAATLRQLYTLRERVRALEKKDRPTP